MPLPTDSETPWPPTWWQPAQTDMEENAAWYSGDPAALVKVYTRADGTDPSARRSVADRLRFWAGKDDPEVHRLHLPVAADVATAAADLLFGETPSLSIPDAHGKKADTEAKATEDRLQELVEEDGVVSTLLEGAEISSGLSGVYLRPVWDPELAQRPILTTVNGDRAVPEFRYGILVAVTFWSVVLREGALVWRHLERHERGVILHGLYCGSERKLGTRRQLKALPATASLAGEAIPLPAGLQNDITARYVPNVRPNRKHRGFPIGRADTAGAEGLMDALDRTWSSWMRDIDLGKLRIIVPDEFLHRTGRRGDGATFDQDQSVFSPLGGMNPQTADKAGITPIEFKLRVEEHAATALALYEAIVRAAMYSPQTFGLHGDGSSSTATEVRARKDQSMTTTGKKQRYWQQGMGDIGMQMLIIDREVFGSKVDPMRPRLDFGDPMGSDIRETASALNLLNLAQAVSIETKVRMVNPELEETEVQAEVKRIKDEQGLGQVPDPTGGGDPFGGAPPIALGDGEGDGEEGDVG